MDELQISGKRFISSRRIARENGYTSDYIGQLIRGGKIVGQKVGRAWYVDAASFEAYLSGEVGASISASTPEVVESAPVVEAIPVVEEKIEEEEILPSVEEVAAEVEEEEEEAEEEVEKEEAAPVVVEKEESVHVPLRIMRAPEEKKETVGLRYVAEDAPSLPEIRSNKKESRIPYESMIEEEEVVEESYPTSSTMAAPKRGSAAVAAVALASIAVFVFCAVVSSALSLNLSIHEGNAAATSYSFEW